MRTHEQLSAEVGSTLAAFGKAIMRNTTDDMLQLMRREGLSMPRMAAVMFLSKRGVASIGDINEHLGLSLGTTSHIVDQLVEAGFVVRRECTDDRRQKLVTLAERGEAFVAEWHAARAADFSRQISGLPDPLLERLLDVLRDVMAELGEAERAKLE